MRLIFKQQQPAFTLIELLLVMGIMAILATVVIVAINPTKQLGQANDVANESKIRALSNALEQYYVESGSWPTGISSLPQTICSSGATGSCLSLDDALTSTLTNARSFISAIPQAEGFESPDSGFVVYLQDSAVQVKAKILGVDHRPEEPNKAYNFDGTNDYIPINLTSPAYPYTISTWVNTNSHAGAKVLLGQSIKGLLLINGRPNFYFTGSNYAYGGAALPIGEWYHVTAVVHGDSSVDVDMYIDGTYESTGSHTVNGPDLGTIGNISLNGTRAFDGKMFDARVYSKALTDDEITYVYSFGENGTDPTAANLVAHYKMDDTNSTVAYDSSGNNNHGTKTNITPTTFHYEGSDVPYSWQNEVGFTSGSNIVGDTINYYAEWVTANTDVVTDQPGFYDGEDTAVQVIPQSVGGVKSWYNQSNVESKYHAVQFYFKPIGNVNRVGLAEGGYGYNSCLFNLDTLTAAPIIVSRGSEQAAVEDMGNGWYRLRTVSDYVAGFRSLRLMPVLDSWSTISGYTVSSEAGDGISGGLFDRIQMTKGYDTLDEAWNALENEVGLVPVNMTADGFLPRDESVITKDVFGNDLQYSGPSS
jgi:prepilin-type N-terminal cleavage/methylation domain-containing protein